MDRGASAALDRVVGWLDFFGLGPRRHDRQVQRQRIDRGVDEIVKMSQAIQRKASKLENPALGLQKSMIKRRRKRH